MEKMIVIIVVVTMKNIVHERYDSYLIYHNHDHHIAYKACQLHHNKGDDDYKSFCNCQITGRTNDRPVSSASGFI